MNPLVYFFRRLALEARIEKAEAAAAYCRAQRRIIEQSIAHHNENLSHLRYELVALDHRADISRLWGRP